MPVSVHTQTFVVIYIYKIDDEAHRGALKIGKASIDSISVDSLTDDCESLRKASLERIDDETITAAMDSDLLWAEVAYYTKDSLGHDFWDKDVHDVLLNSGIKRRIFPNLRKKPMEWFDVDLETAKAAIKAVKDGRQSLDLAAPVKAYKPIIFRVEQEKAITETLDHFNIGDKMLWNAKMRFGKTLCALELIRRLEKHQRTLILTHRPTVRSGWFDDFKLIKFENFKYGSKPNSDDRTGGNQNINVGESFEWLEEHAKSDGINYIYFASLQDLRGSIEAGGKFDKDKGIFDAKWDLVIIDEAHEGTQTSLGKKVLSKLQRKKPKMLYLSGTPYNILDQFMGEEIYTWDYNMEQEAKENWPKEHPGEKNPYEGLAKLNIRTYNLGTAFEKYTHTDEDYFNFREFFRIWSELDTDAMPDDAKVGDFVHKNDVQAFLDLLCKEDPTSEYPFANPEFIKCFAHTFWILPGVKEAAALQALLDKHPFFGKNGKNYEIVNVAGEGSPAFEEEEEEETEEEVKEKEKKDKDAFRRVKSAIAANPRTITLSCGRLTTGVSVEEWTGVLMLAGSYNTKASTYLQTIFRGQTPYKKTPGIKPNCYVFDFAPDRTLTVINEYLDEDYTKGKGGHHEKTHRIEKFLKFCSVISFDGSKTVEYDTKTFIIRVNQAYSDHVIRNGFKDRRLYKPLKDFTEEDLRNLEIIGEIMHNSSKGKGGSTVDVNKENVKGNGGKGGRSGGSGGKTGGSGLGKGTKKSPEQQRREKSMSVLHQISIRLPMMLFGGIDSIESLTLNKFIDSIDKASWEEFMPKGLTQELFKKISHLYVNDLFVAIANNILDETKKAEALNVTERASAMARILSNFHYPDKETVLTPWRVVNMHLSDCIGGYDFFSEKHGAKDWLSEPRLVDRGQVTRDVFDDENTKILEINSKSGVYPLYMAYSAFKFQQEAQKNGLFGSSHAIYDEDIWKSVVENNIYVICQTPMAEKITHRVLAGYKDIKTNTLYYPKLFEAFKDEKKMQSFCKKARTGSNYNESNTTKDMKFNVIVGNPPYQVMDNGAGASAKSVYHYFVNTAKALSPKYISMIMPARWYTAGKETKDIEAFRTAMFKDTRISILHDFISSSQCFEGVEIKGGVCYFLIDESHKGDTNIVTHNSDGSIIDTNRPMIENWAEGFIRNPEMISILKKVKAKNEKGFVDIVSSRDPFGYDIRLPNSQKTAPHKYVLEKTKEADVEFYYNGWRNSGLGYVALSSVNEHKDWVDKYKVLVPRSWGSGNPAKDRLRPMIIGKHAVCTETYVVIGPFNKEEIAQNAKSYIETKFFHALVSILKISQQAARKVYGLVPSQDFTKSWTDKELYEKYGFSDKEKAFIEAYIKSE